jgi:hypothetical protein
MAKLGQTLPSLRLASITGAAGTAAAPRTGQGRQEETHAVQQTLCAVAERTQ